jgi:hypothetical protein
MTTTVTPTDRTSPARTDYTALTDVLAERYPEFDRQALEGVAQQLVWQIVDAIPVMPTVREATAEWLQREGVVPLSILYEVPYLDDSDPDSKPCLAAGVDIRVTRTETRSILVVLGLDTGAEHWRVDEVVELPS